MEVLQFVCNDDKGLRFKGRRQIYSEWYPHFSSFLLNMRKLTRGKMLKDCLNMAKHMTFRQGLNRSIRPMVFIDIRCCLSRYAVDLTFHLLSGIAVSVPDTGRLELLENLTCNLLFVKL